MIRHVSALVVLLLLLPTICLAQIHITVSEEAMVSGQQIQFGEIAAIDGDESDRIASLARIPLGSAPAPGARAVITRDMLTTRLAASQTDFSGITWSAVPDQISIVTGGQTIRGATLADVAMTKLKQRIKQAPGEEIQLQIGQEVPDLTAPLGVISYDISVNALRFGLPQTLYLSVLADGVLFSKVPIRYEMKRYAAVVTAAENIGARQALAKENIRVTKTDVSRMPAGYLTDPEEIVGLTVKRALPAGTILYSSHLDKPVLIKRGAAITITATISGIEVNASGVAQADGREGQYISVRNTTTGKLVKGRVVNKEQVNVSI